MKNFRKHCKRETEFYLKYVGLEEYRHRKFENLSGGNQRKLLLAIALIGRPPMVILDEPSAGVDPAARANLREIIQRSATAKNGEKEGNLIMISTHVMDEAEALCDRVSLMAHGRSHGIGSCASLKVFVFGFLGPF